MSRSRFFKLLAGAGALAALALMPSASAREIPRSQPVLVELFTSQGCSSCPAADRLLGELQRRDDVVALSFSIDYWDYIGWHDTLAHHDNTLRQQAYEKTLQSHRIYTPQMVVDGAIDVIGNERRDVYLAIEKRHDQVRGKRVAIALLRDGDTVRVTIGQGETKAPATIWLAHTQSARTVNIAKGENGGKTVTYHNIVRDFGPVGQWTGAPVALALPAKSLRGDLSDGVAVWVQMGENGAVSGAAQIRW